MRKFVVTAMLLLAVFFSFAQNNTSIKEVWAKVPSKNWLEVNASVEGEPQPYVINIMLGNEGSPEPISGFAARGDRPDTVRALFPVLAGKGYEVRILFLAGGDTTFLQPMVVSIPIDSGLTSFIELYAEEEAKFYLDGWNCLCRNDTGGLDMYYPGIIFDSDYIRFRAPSMDGSSMSSYIISRRIQKCDCPGASSYWIQNMGIKDAAVFDSTGHVTGFSMERRGAWRVNHPFGFGVDLEAGIARPDGFFRFKDQGGQIYSLTFPAGEWSIFYIQQKE